jgi:uroporphyrin-III C-methyltransferase/precorrin-2 dehydrogenase/sirohydrochlorin ferrochelatase
MHKQAHMEFLPLFHNVRGKLCVVVGGDETAWRKIQWLLKAGALVTVVSDTILPTVDVAVTEAGGQCIPCDTSDTDTLTEILAGVFSDCSLVIGATDDAECNMLVSALAQMQNIPVNIVDCPELCSFIFPSIVERGLLTVAVSTGGNAPVMARLIRAKIESWLPVQLTTLIAVVGAIREPIRELLPTTRTRMRFWDTVLQDSLLGTASDTAMVCTETTLLQKASVFKTQQQAGCVDTIHLDSIELDHLRFFQLRLLQATDVLVFDATLPEPIRNLARRDAERICVNMNEAQAIAHIKCTERLRVLIVHCSPCTVNKDTING